MVIEDIYNKIYADTEEMTEDDHEISQEITPLIDGVTPKDLTQEEFIDLMCQASAIGARRGFVSGFRFFGKLIFEALM